MNVRIAKMAAAAGCVALVMLSGCATSVSNVTAQSDSEAVVFGKFQLIRNGETVKLGDGIFANSATLKILNNGTQQEFDAKVGDGGEFAWALEPGDYYVSTISFSNRGERVEPSAGFTFAVAEDASAVYVGTITLEATFDAGYYGVDGVINGHSVRNDCDTDCGPRLEELGFDESAATVALLRR